MNTKQIYVYHTGEFFPIDMEKLSHQTIDEILHYGLEKFLNQKANSLVRKEDKRKRGEEETKKKCMSREEICERVLGLIHAVEQGYITLPHTKTLEEEVAAKLLSMTDEEKEVYRRLLTE